MTVPLEVDFWNMPPDAAIQAAAQNEAHSLETDSPITSCRVRVTPNSYAVQIVVLAGSTMLRFEGDSGWSRMLPHPRATWSNKGDPDAGAILHRAFAEIHRQFPNLS